MLNQIVALGRLTKDIELQESENGKKYSLATIAIPRAFKNADGIYETDFLSFKMFDKIAENCSEYCKKGDIVAIKGRMQSNTYEKDGETKYSMDIIAEKLTFLSNRSKDYGERSELWFRFFWFLKGGINEGIYGKNIYGII